MGGRPAAALLLAAALLAVPAAAQPVPGFAVTVPYVSPADGAARSYDLRVPGTWDGASRLPAILFLHGRGGTRRQFQRTAFFDEADARGVVLLFWEGRLLPGEEGIPSTRYLDGADGVPDESDVLASLDDALARAPIDPDRVALAGFSQGGRGALTIGLLNPSRFAALVDAAGPTDAFQGQLWSPSFPDYLSAAGGPPSAGGAVLARWFELSPRHLLPNARNLFVAVLHGQSDDVVPDASALFPYRNSHHVTLTPGFVDERGPRPTLGELRAEDPAGYAFTTSFPEGVGHDQLRLLPPDALFDAAVGPRRPARPGRVVGVSFGAKERTFHWARLARLEPPDGTRAFLDARADEAGNAVDLAVEGSVRVRLDLPAAGLDAGRELAVRLSGAPRIDFLLAGPFPPSLRARVDGAETPFLRTEDGVVLAGLVPRAGGSLLVVSAAPPGPLAEGDLLVPALVRGDGRNGARYDTVLAVGNLSEGELLLEALLLDGRSSPAALAIPPRSSRALPAELFLPAGGTAAAPLRLRVVSGDAGSVAATARVFNRTAEGTYGLSFPVGPAGAGLLEAGRSALLFGPKEPGAERLNVSLFAPFEASSAEVTVRDGAGAVRRAVPVAVAPLGRVQLDDLLAGEGPGASVRVSVLAGRLQLYGTAVSNGPTNDPWRVPALPLESAARAWTVPAVASAPGLGGAVFRSDLFLLSPAGDVVEATLLPRDGSPPASAAVPLPPDAPVVVADLLAALFPAKVPGAGALVLSSSAPFLPLSVTRSDPAAGASSQDLPCVPAGAEARAGRPVAFAGVDESDAARSNLVLAAPEGPARVTLVLQAADGVRGELAVDLPARGVVQLDSVARRVAPGAVDGATLLVRVGSGSVVASVARIDNGTQDPAGLAPIPVEAP